MALQSDIAFDTIDPLSAHSRTCSHHSKLILPTIPPIPNTPHPLQTNKLQPMLLNKFLRAKAPPINKLLATNVTLLDTEALRLLEQQEQITMRPALILGSRCQVLRQCLSVLDITRSVSRSRRGNVDDDPVAPVGEFRVIRCWRIGVDEEERERLRAAGV